MHYLYWIHLPNHTDPYSEGYIGISKQPAKRFRAHISDTASVGSKFLRHLPESEKAKLVHKILASVSTLDEARELELSYRPSSNIGWNIKRGGGITPDCTGRVHSETTKKDIAKKNVLTKSKRTYVSPFKGVTGRYSEETKQLIGSYHKGKTISDAHKKAITEKLSGANNPKSKEIHILDMVTNISYKFEAMGMASKELGINYSAIRSAVQSGRSVIYKRYKIVEDVV